MRIPRLLALVIIGLTPLLVGSSPNTKPPFALSIRPLQTSVSAGSEVRIEIALTNIADHEIGILRSAAEADYLVEVRDEQGKMAPDTEFGRRRKAPGSISVSTATPLYMLKPREVLKDEIVVNRFHDMSVPARYAISVTRAIPEELGSGVVKSNTVTVTVTP